MNTRAGLILALALGLPAAPLVAEAQQARKVARVGYLAAVSAQNRPNGAAPRRAVWLFAVTVVAGLVLMLSITPS
jgi:hypothetical protein